MMLRPLALLAVLAGRLTPSVTALVAPASRRVIGWWPSPQRLQWTAAAGEGFDKPPARNLPGLRKEADRQVYRQLKKVGKAELRLERAKAAGGEFDGKHEDEFVLELQATRDRLARIQALEAALRGVKSTESPAFAELVPEIDDLGLKDKPPPRNPPRPKKPKGKRPEGPRLPYRTYVSTDGVDIRVGKNAADNDELSTKPEHRHSTEWWMHAAGAAGSHVVIRSSLEMDELPRETVMDAAALAAKYSKAGNRKVAVSLTRCRNVSKPPGAKPGLVFIAGEVKTIKLDLRLHADRLERLESELAARTGQ